MIDAINQKLHQCSLKKLITIMAVVHLILVLRKMKNAELRIKKSQSVKDNVGKK